MTLTSLVEQFSQARMNVHAGSTMPISNALDRFLDDRRISVAANTLDLYRNTVRRLVASTDDIPVAMCSRQHISALIDEMKCMGSIFCLAATSVLRSSAHSATTELTFPTPRVHSAGAASAMPTTR